MLPPSSMFTTCDDRKITRRGKDNDQADSVILRDFAFSPGTLPISTRFNTRQAGSSALRKLLFWNRYFGGIMASVKITVRKNGPYRVEAPEGTIELVDADGTAYDLTGKPAFSLCRCGGSVNKPFCDGTHSKLGFQAAELAVKKAEGL